MAYTFTTTVLMADDKVEAKVADHYVVLHLTKDVSVIIGEDAYPQLLALADQCEKAWSSTLQEDTQ